MEKLQGLLDKIYNDGIKKFKFDGENLIKNAQKEAELIILNAKAQAKLILNKSISQAKQNEIKFNLIIKQIARDIIISIEKNILDRFKNCVSESVNDTLTCNFMKEIIEKIINIYNKEKDNSKIDISIMFASKDINEMTKYFINKVNNSFKVNPKILEDEGMGSGLKINFKNNDFYLDYSNDSLTNIICKFVEPKFVKIIKE